MPRAAVGVVLALLAVAVAEEMPGAVDTTEAGGLAVVGDPVQQLMEEIKDNSLEQIQEEAFESDASKVKAMEAVRAGVQVPAPLKMAKTACQAAWLETKKQCNVITVSSKESLGLLKIQIKAGGEAIQKAVLKTLTPDSTSAVSNSTEVSLLKVRARKMAAAFERLGEDLDEADENVDQTAIKKTLAHMACQSFWQQVESLCTKADQKSDDSADAVTVAIKEEGKEFESKASTVASTAPDPTPAPAPPAQNSTAAVLESQRLGEEQYAEDTEFHNLDMMDPSADVTSALESTLA